MHGLYFLFITSVTTFVKNRTLSSGSINYKSIRSNTNTVSGNRVEQKGHVLSPSCCFEIT